jgi:hypothetical protein
MTELERDFHLLMKSIYDRAKKECNYNAVRFLKMLQDHEGLKTAQILLKAPTVSDGFVELYMRDRLDLTVEAQILANEKFWPLFERKELDTARRWIKEYEDKQKGKATI